ncbi:CotH kinase family protein [Paenibacillus montanisoli]|uniref:Spore coat protein CotH n=1 Tax=Paenibacillus montanisoli TaxID=2081970 RepID=A0A328UAD5_9BACL|nr:CotH kinase family protein [Paenibacillus montanisoli]RAP77016.1 spore coat protein CotH [Paenibacillus montanisoli]
MKKTIHVKLAKPIGIAALCVVLLAGCRSGETNNAGSESTGSVKTAATAATAATDANTAKLEYVAEMDKEQIMSFSIDADKTEWEKMLKNAAAEEYISANVTINGTTIKNVGIRPKGNSSLRQVLNDEKTDRFSFKIKFDEYVQDQTWKGLDSIVINNMISDTSYMKEYLSYDIMSSIGVDAPLFAFADIKLNGEAWGFYLAVEDIDGGYLDRAKEGEGELYKPNNDGKNMGGPMGGAKGDLPQGGDMPAPPDNAGQMEMPPADGGAAAGGEAAGGEAAGGNRGGGGFGGNRGGGRGGMNGAQNGVSLVYTDDKLSSYSAIFDNAETKTTEEDQQRVITALKNLNAGTDLSKYVDVDAVLKYFAAHTVVVNMDSYTSTMGHNYYLYENNGQISMLPWDYNMAFGGFQGGKASDIVNLAIDTPLSGVSLEDRPILGKLLEVPEYKEKYHQYLQEIVDDYFADGKFEQKVESINKLISDYVKNDPSKFSTYEAYQTAVTELTKLGTLRAESIQGQLNGDIPSTTDGQKDTSSKLVDASSVDLAKIGSMGPGGGFGKGMPGGNGFGGEGGFPAGMDRDTMDKAFDIVSSAENGKLTDEQKEQLRKLGLSDEQIDQMLNMPQFPSQQ